jgi:hypothetical protein
MAKPVEPMTPNERHTGMKDAIKKSLAGLNGHKPTVVVVVTTPEGAAEEAAEGEDGKAA